ncbi:MAG: hypothetical protein INQ03_18905 [Candidatus Heimdallarchaeota archaeon]|nr:hypothetical protein [Candidatus Heimdallarchaeota archaeon]
MNTIFMLGLIFTLGGLIILILGTKRGVPNSILWALFPILHGFHEFAEYYLDEINDTLLIERVEIFFAISSSLVLLAASIEFLGVVPRPYGKLSSFIGLTVVSYFIFASSEELFNEMEHLSFHFGSFEAPFFRFFFGFILILISLISIFISFIILKNQERKGLSKVDSTTTKIVMGSLVLLAIFAFFEGFRSDNAIFITLRGISAILFLLVPALILFSNKLGLQVLLITTINGTFVTGYDFVSRTILEDDKAILMANFIAAIASFGKNESQIGELSQIASSQGSFLVKSTDSFLVTVLTRNTTSVLENKIVDFSLILNELIVEEGSEFKISFDGVKNFIEDKLGSFY